MAEPVFYSRVPNPAKAKFQLRFVLLIFLAALAVPLLFLFQRIYWQLENEVLYQHRSNAEEVVARINSRLQELLQPEEARPFDEYNYYKVDQIPLQASKGLIYSPLSEYPPKSPIPGMLGYFQVNPDGSLQSPILPKLEAGGAVSGMTADELTQRIASADRLYNILAGEFAADVVGEAGRQENDAAPKPALPAVQDAKKKQTELSAKQIAEVVIDNRLANQQLAPDKLLAKNAFSDRAQKVTDLNLDSKYLARESEKKAKSESAAPMRKVEEAKEGSSLRERRTEKVDLAISAGSFEDALNESESMSNGAAAAGAIRESDLEVPGARVTSPLAGVSKDGAAQSFKNPSQTEPSPEAQKPEDKQKKRTAVRILTLEGEVDPFQFKVLDSTHFLFIRKVWRDGQRYLQGFVIDEESLVRELITNPFQASALSATGTLIVGYQGVYFKRVEGQGVRAKKMNSDREIVLYRRSLAAPFDDVELLFTTPELARGPGAGIVNALGYAILLVLLSGLLGLYRLGVRQIDLAKERSDFVSAVSHELKTPLTSIRMYSEMLRENWVTDEGKKKSYYDYIFHESERLSRLIANVLQFSKLSNTKAELDLKVVEAQVLLELSRERTKAQTDAAGFQLMEEIEDRRADTASPAHVKIDADAFLRICINLVDNAIKFSAAAAEKKIVIAVRIHESELYFSVRDFGPGVPRSKMKHIFKLFYRAEDEMSRATSGTGIGLALVRELALKMNATVDLRNQNPGAEFLLRMPIVNPA